MRSRWIELAAPLAVCAVMFLPDTPARLLAIGVVTSVAFCATVGTGFSPSVLLLIATAAVRWIPWSDVIIWREMLVFAGVLSVRQLNRVIPSRVDGEESPSGRGSFAVYAAQDDTATFAALAVAVVTPSMPTRGLFFPFLVAACCMLPAPFRIGLSAVFLAAIPLARYSFAPMLVVAAIVCALPLVRRIPVIPQTAAVALLALWPWSGLLARSFPAFLRVERPQGEHRQLWQAISAPQSVSVEVPERTKKITLTLSGGSTAHLWPGSVLGRVELGRTVREFGIGDIADFGFMRREHFLSSHNAPPRAPAGGVREFGASAWMWGAGHMTFYPSRDARTLRVIAMRPGVAIQVESIDFE